MGCKVNLGWKIGHGTEKVENHCFRPINKIIKNLQPLLNKDPHLNQIFSTPPLISYRQPPNLKLLLTSASLPNEHFITGTFPCKSSKCHLCPNINTNPTITGPNGVPIKISGNFSCNSSNIIYAILCNLCPKAIYIGEQATLSDNGWTDTGATSSTTETNP